MVRNAGFIKQRNHLPIQFKIPKFQSLSAVQSLETLESLDPGHFDPPPVLYGELPRADWTELERWIEQEVTPIEGQVTRPICLR